MKWLICIFLFCHLSLKGQDARDIIKRYLDTVSNGNIENWTKIKSIYMESEGSYSQQNFERKIHFSGAGKPGFSKHFIRPRYGSRIDGYTDSTFSELKDSFYFLKNRRIIILGAMPPIINKKPPKSSEFSSIHTPVFVRNLVSKCSAIEIMGIRDFPTDGLQCYEIRVHAQDRNYYFYINTETYLMDFWSISSKEDPAFLTKFYNYRKVGELLMPMSSAAMRNGVIYFSLKRRKVELNPKFDPGILRYKEKT